MNLDASTDWIDEFHKGCLELEKLEDPFTRFKREMEMIAAHYKQLKVSPKKPYLPKYI